MSERAAATANLVCVEGLAVPLARHYVIANLVNVSRKSSAVARASLLR